MERVRVWKRRRTVSGRTLSLERPPSLSRARTNARCSASCEARPAALCDAACAAASAASRAACGRKTTDVLPSHRGVFGAAEGGLAHGALVVASAPPASRPLCNILVIALAHLFRLRSRLGFAQIPLRDNAREVQRERDCGVLRARRLFFQDEDPFLLRRLGGEYRRGRCRKPGDARLGRDSRWGGCKKPVLDWEESTAGDGVTRQVVLASSVTASRLLSASACEEAKRGGKPRWATAGEGHSPVRREVRPKGRRGGKGDDTGGEGHSPAPPLRGPLPATPPPLPPPPRRQPRAPP